MTVTLKNEYKMTMTLNIRNLSAEFFGGYRCIVRNSLGETDGMIRLYGNQAKRELFYLLFWTLPSHGRTTIYRGWPLCNLDAIITG